MKYGKPWSISKEKKLEYIDRLLPHLASLRARAGLSQDELAGLIGVSRQTYCLTESGARSLSWNTYLSLVMFFDYNSKTRDLLRGTRAFPEDLFYQFNPGENRTQESSFDRVPELNILFSQLDDSGKNSVRTALAAEYSRCKGLDKTDLLKLMNELLSSK